MAKCNLKTTIYRGVKFKRNEINKKMKTLKIFWIFIVLVGCANNIPKSNRVSDVSVIDNNMATIKVVRKIGLFDVEQIWSKIEKIYDQNKKIVYESSMWSLNSPAKVNIPEGKYKIMFTCHTSVWNDNWMNIELEAGGDYTVFCLTETRGKSAFGQNYIAALHPFFEKTSELQSKKKEYQLIIDAPSKADIDAPIENGKTRLITFYEPAKFLGIENRYRYTVTLNGKYIDKIDPLKYTTADITNGQYNYQINNNAPIKDIANIQFNAEGGMLYILCKENNVSSMNCEVSKERPSNFYQIKPMHIFQY